MEEAEEDNSLEQKGSDIPTSVLEQEQLRLGNSVALQQDNFGQLALPPNLHLLPLPPIAQSQPSLPSQLVNQQQPVSGNSSSVATPQTQPGQLMQPSDRTAVKTEQPDAAEKHPRVDKFMDDDELMAPETRGSAAASSSVIANSN
jgi:hypothetical protein